MRAAKWMGWVVMVVVASAGCAFGQDPNDRVSGEKLTLTLRGDAGEHLLPGQTRVFTEADSKNMFVILIGGTTGHPSSVELLNDSWDLTFEQAVDSAAKPLTVGIYPRAIHGAVLPGFAGLNFSIGGNGCNSISGNFTITALAYDCHATVDFPSVLHLKQLNASFDMHCDGEKPFLHGLLTYVDNTGFACDTSGTGGNGGPGGGTGDGSGGNGTPAPQGPVVVLSDELRTTPVLMANASSTSVLFSTFVPSTTTMPVTLSASSDADDLLVSVTPSLITSTGTIDAVAKITTTSTTLAGDHAVTITATDGTTTSSATVFVTVLCDPPFILGIDQPKGSTVALGRPAQLSVKASGSGPFTYQWFTGASGLSNFPLPGGTSANFTTSALNDTTSYWVRITNPCGSVNSQTATVNVSAGAKPTGRR